LSPCPSAGTPPAWRNGASGDFSASVTNGEAPTARGPSLRPTTIESRNTWHSATTAITGASHGCRTAARRNHHSSAPPTAVVITIQRRNEPSCPAQNAENVYRHGIAWEVCWNG